MKIYRLLSIINVMLSKELVTAKYLAEKHEVSIKTIQRDIETLNMAGIPVYSKKGIHGGYGILDTYKLDSKLLSSQDITLMKSMLDGLSNVYNNKSLESLWEKLESAVIRSSDVGTAKMTVDFTPWNEDRSLQDKLNLISDAIVESRILSIEYHNSHGMCLLREIEPYELILRHGRWYVLAHCLQKQEMRTFKLNRISNIAIMDRFFNARDYKTLQNQVSKRHDGIKKVLQFKKSAYYRVVDIFNDDEIMEMTEEDITVETYLKIDPWLIFVILSFGEDVKVIEPNVLKDQIRNKIIKMNEIYK